MALGPSPFSLNGTCFRLRMMSVASSTTPGMDWNSCSTPSILTAVTAAPSMDDSSTRRSALPMVVPKPRSKGCAQKRPYLSLRVSVSVASRLGFWKPFQSIRFLLGHVGHSPLVRRPMRGHCRECLIWLDDVGRNNQSPVGSRKAADLTTEDLLAVQLDDQLLVDGQVDVFALRQRGHAPAQVLAVHFQPVRRGLV